MKKGSHAAALLLLFAVFAGLNVLAIAVGAVAVGRHRACHFGGGHGVHLLNGLFVGRLLFCILFLTHKKSPRD